MARLALACLATCAALRAPATQPQGTSLRADRAFAPNEAKGGAIIDASKTALLLIEYQNEFTSEGGKLHDAVKDTMASTNMLERSAKLAEDARKKGVTIIHAPITFKEDASDNPNKGLGILAGCATDKLFTEGTWNADFHESMKPATGDLVVENKKGLDAFPGTNLEALLKENKIETLALSGFLTNCCVEKVRCTRPTRRASTRSL